jgi:hypothetical protein
LVEATLKKKFLKFLLVLLALSIAIQHWPVRLHILGCSTGEDFSVPVTFKDKRRLEYFFRDVCFLNAWAYTLLGSKPMSIHQYTKPLKAMRNVAFHPELNEILLTCFWPPNLKEICYLFNPEQLKIKNGWDALNKHMRKIRSNRFALFSFDKGDVVVLALVDKIKLIQIVDRHGDDFKEILETLNISSKELMIEDNLYLFLKSIHSDGLLGTLLGFGRENAWLFQKYKNMNSSLLDRPMKGAWEGQESEYLEKICKKTRSFSPWDVSDLFYPPFACSPNSEETKKIKERYEEDRERIIHYYQGKDVVEATLSLFNQK